MCVKHLYIYSASSQPPASQPASTQSANQRRLVLRSHPNTPSPSMHAHLPRLSLPAASASAAGHPVWAQRACSPSARCHTCSPSASVCCSRAGHPVWGQRRQGSQLGLLLCPARGVGTKPGEQPGYQLACCHLPAGRLPGLPGTAPATGRLHTCLPCIKQRLRHLPHTCHTCCPPVPTFSGCPPSWPASCRCPPQVDNQAALALAQRFLNNKREFDGTPSRDRLKLVPRIINVDQWAQEGPLTGG